MNEQSLHQQHVPVAKLLKVASLLAHFRICIVCIIRPLKAGSPTPCSTSKRSVNTVFHVLAATSSKNCQPLQAAAAALLAQ